MEMLTQNTAITAKEEVTAHRSLAFALIASVTPLFLLCVAGHAVQRRIAADKPEGDKAAYASIRGEPRNRTITVHHADGSVETVLSIAALPEQFEGIPFGMGNQSFADAALSPDERAVCFAVTAHVGWVGILDLSSRSVRPTLFVPEGSADRILGWSPDSRYCVAQLTLPSGFKSIRVIDVNSGIVAATAFEETADTHDPNLRISDLSWDHSARVLRFQVHGSQDRRERFEYSLQTHSLSRIPGPTDRRPQ